MRGIVWLAIALLFFYALFELYRGLRAGSAKAAGGTSGESAFEADEDELNRFVLERAYASDSSADVADDPEAQAASPWVTPAAPAAEPAEPFRATLEVETLRREVTQMQAQLASQRREMDEMVDEVRALKAQLEAATVSQSISPEYNEALVFAKRGLDVDAIAERCGISRSEAELVHALAQRRGGEHGQENGE